MRLVGGSGANLAVAHRARHLPGSPSLKCDFPRRWWSLHWAGFMGLRRVAWRLGWGVCGSGRWQAGSWLTLPPIARAQQPLCIPQPPSLLGASQVSVAPLRSQAPPQLLRNIKLFSPLSEASFVQSVPGGMIVPCTGLTGQSQVAYTESQHGRGWQGPLWVPQCHPLPKQGHAEQGAQDRVQAGLEYLQRRRFHNLPGQPVAGLCHTISA